jgi:ATP-binding cassette subfamily B protein
VRPEPEERLVEFHPVYMTGPLPELTPPVRCSPPFSTLEVRNLAFHYPSNGKGIQGISFRFVRGSLTVITGRIGSGKTTVLRTLLGLLPMERGEIRWNVQLVTDVAEFFRPPRSAYTPQSPRLFSDSLRENLLLGLPDGEAGLERAVRAGVLEEDVANLAQGWDTLVGPRGVRLSGGQIQRAAAVRMFLREPELILLDDISSALDVNTEQVLWQRLAERREATCLAVSHRKPVLKRADQVIVLKEGSVVGVGKLDELLQTCEEMREMWRGEVLDHE